LASIILITGTPGVGKTVLAKSLSRNSGFKLVELGKLVRKERLYTHFDRARKTYVVDEGKLRKRLKALSRSSERIVLPTHLIGRFLPKASVLLGPRKVYEIDTTRKSAASVYREALRALSIGRTGRSGVVNWLARYDPLELERTL
jgi:broad-specificity NMP kinase